MTHFSIDLGNIEQSRKALVMLADIIIIGGDFSPSEKPINMPYLNSEIDKLYATILAIEKLRTTDKFTYGLAKYGLLLVDGMRTTLKELVEGNASKPSQIPLMFDRKGNCFVMDEETGVLTRCGNLFDKH
jgi:hypothetical protein